MLDTFKIETFEDILKALKERPDWLEELRRIILTEELIALPQKFETFLQKEFRPLREKVDRMENDIDILKQDVAVLKQDVAVLKQDVADLKGDNFERKVRERAPSYFGRFIKRCRVITHEELANSLDDAVEEGIITEDEKQDALNIDVVVTGYLKEDREKKVVIASEVSLKADRADVERAYERANIIGRAMRIPAIAVAIGKETTEGAKNRSEELGVILC